MPKSYEISKGRAKNKRFLALFDPLTGHQNFIKLSAYSNKLIIDLGRQYFGSNNGDLCATWSMMKARGWKSRETLTDALRELEYYGFIVTTQYGDRKKPTLYALAWVNIDKAIGECKNLKSTTPNGWKVDKKRFVKPSTKRYSKKSVTRNAGQTSTECVSKMPKLEMVK